MFAEHTVEVGKMRKRTFACDHIINYECNHNPKHIVRIPRLDGSVIDVCSDCGKVLDRHGTPQEL